MENSPIEEAHTDGVKLKSGQKINGDLVIWTAGIKPNRLLSRIQGLPKATSGKMTVDLNLRLTNFENVFAVGDNTEFIDPKSQHSVPAMAYVASDQGKVVAKNIFNILSKKPLKKYKPFFDVWIIPVGGKYALAHLWGGINIKGFWGWIIRQLVDLRYLLSIFSLNKALEVYWNEVTIFSKND